jgi:hypothetical protein
MPLKWWKAWGIKPMSKANRERLESELATHLERQGVLDHLRNHYRLNVGDCVGDLPSRVQARQKQYQEHLERLRKIWAEEDLKEK